MKKLIESNIYQRGRKYYVSIIRSGCDFSYTFNTLKEAQEYLAIARSLNHKNRIWKQDYLEYMGQSFIFLRKDDQVYPIIVDNDRADELMKINWYITNSGYAFGCIKGKKLFMHQHIRPTGKQGYVVNHINHNRLDNRIQNLEVITQSENIQKGYQNKKEKEKQIVVAIS